MSDGPRHAEKRLRRTASRRRRFPALRRVASVLMLLATSSAATAAGPSPVTPTAQDRCTVCGMFTAKYPEFLAQVAFADGAYLTFDGPKDLFKHLLDPETYGGRNPAAGDGIFVTEYYSLEPIDARAAFFVVGSDVLGPMGHELVPFATRDDAEEFKRDHRGSAVLPFAGVTLEVLEGLARMK